MLVDLRSDTVTRPTPEMRRAMATAEVGDDEYGEDPTVNLLQEIFAELIGKEAALYVPSGTMANQIAVRGLTRPGDAVVTGRRQHVVAYEAGAAALNAGVNLVPVSDDGGVLDADEVEVIIASEAHHQPKVGLIALEDTHMASGGLVWSPPARDAIAALAARHAIPVHLDGARLWNAAVASGETVAARAGQATTVMCCLSKGLGAPVGSLLAGPADFIVDAKLHRKRLGGTMRQAGIIASAGVVALRGGIERLSEDHARAKRLAEARDRWPSCLDADATHTNIVAFYHPDPTALIDHLATSGVRAGTIAPHVVRLVTHRDVDDAGIDLACQSISKAP